MFRRIAIVATAVLAIAATAVPAQAQVFVTGSIGGYGINVWPSMGTQVTISDSGFNPSNLTLQVNGVVTFVNMGTTTHTAVTPTGVYPSFDTTGLAPGQAASFQITTTGTFPYVSNTEGDTVVNNNNGNVTRTYKLQGTITVQNGPVSSAAPSAAPAPAPTATPAPQPCKYVLGFATIAAAVPQVGACLDDQAFAPNGDSVQHTSGGLLVWRKSDNWTAFTDGYRTWINGPNGIAQRLNTARFPWEH